jgi:hypothetical protein
MLCNASDITICPGVDPMAREERRISSHLHMLISSDPLREREQGDWRHGASLLQGQTFSSGRKDRRVTRARWGPTFSRNGLSPTPFSTGRF